MSNAKIVVAVGFAAGVIGLASAAYGQGSAPPAGQTGSQSQAGTTSPVPSGEGLTVAQCSAGFAPSYGVSRAQFDTFCQAQLGGSAPTGGAASGAVTGPGVGSSSHSGASQLPEAKK
jgi:hypothetical protein